MVAAKDEFKLRGQGRDNAKNAYTHERLALQNNNTRNTNPPAKVVFDNLTKENHRGLLGKSENWRMMAGE